MQNGNLEVVIREMAQRVKESEAREIKMEKNMEDMDQNMKTMEEALTATIT